MVVKLVIFLFFFLTQAAFDATKYVVPVFYINCQMDYIFKMFANVESAERGCVRNLWSKTVLVFLF